MMRMVCLGFAVAIFLAANVLANGMWGSAQAAASEDISAFDGRWSGELCDVSTW